MINCLRVLLSCGLLGVPAAAAAQEAAPSLLLSCSGTDTTIESASSTVRFNNPHNAAESANANLQSMREVRVPATMTVAIKDGLIRIRPPATSLPTFSRKPADGWYDLDQVSITADQFAGRAPYGGIISGKWKLRVDRRSGDATFGAFRGSCEKASNDPEARKF